MDGDGVGVQRVAGTRGEEAGMAEDGLSDLTQNASYPLKEIEHACVP
jgi:hypothetical protein